MIRNQLKPVHGHAVTLALRMGGRGITVHSEQPGLYGEFQVSLGCDVRTHVRRNKTMQREEREIGLGRGTV